jgi:hypothetical protein
MDIPHGKNPMQRDFFYAFGIDRRSTAIVAFFMAQWPHLSHPAGFGNHLFLDELERRGIDFVCRMFGSMVLGALRISHAATRNKYVFEPITPARLIDYDSNIERLPPVERGEILPFHVAVGLSNSFMSLEFVDHDAGQKALSMARGIPLHELQSLGPDSAATSVGATVLRMLVRLHPAAFDPFPSLVLKA